MKGVDAGYMHYQYVFIVLNKQMLGQMNSFYNWGFDKLKIIKTNKCSSDLFSYN